jgi:maltose-binding protein MalE
MKKLFRIFSLCLLVLMLVPMVSCTKKKTKDKITFWVYDAGRIEVLNELGKKFEAEFGVGVEVSMVDLGQIRNQFLLASGGDECADIAIIPHDNLGTLVENGMVVEINLGAKKDSYLEPALDGFNYNGKLYGVPLAVENIGFFYNTSMMSAPPETWDDAVTIAKNLISAKKADVMMGLPDATYNAYPVYDSYGGAIFGRKSDGSLDGKNVLMADAGFTAGLEFLTSLVKQKLVPENIDWDAAHVLFESGKAPFCMTGPWALNRFRTAGVPYGISKFPAVRKGGQAGNPFLGVQGMIISSASPRKLLAQSFAVDFIAREENMQAIFNAEQRPSAWKSIFENSGDADTRGFNAAGVKAVPMPSIPEMGNVWDAWVAAAALAFSGDRTPVDALQNAKSQILNR